VQELANSDDEANISQLDTLVALFVSQAKLRARARLHQNLNRSMVVNLTVLLSLLTCLQRFETGGHAAPL
jgi:hypothetical protein